MCEYGYSRLIVKESLVHPFERYANPAWIDRHGGIPVDACIKDEVQDIIERGVITLGCCCGHLKSDHTECMIHEDSVSLAKMLGYSPYRYDGDYRYIIHLNTPPDVTYSKERHGVLWISNCVPK